MSKSFVLRSYAADAALRANVPGFRTYLGREGMWKFIDSAKVSPAAEWAKGKEWVAWVEVIEETNAPPKGVIVVRLTKEELAEESIPSEFIVEPITTDLWEVQKPFDPSKPATTGGDKPARVAGERARSDVASPTKLVWQIADEMVGAQRSVVVARCIELGVNKATAATQYYRWQKARGDKGA